MCVATTLILVADLPIHQISSRRLTYAITQASGPRAGRTCGQNILKKNTLYPGIGDLRLFKVLALVIAERVVRRDNGFLQALDLRRLLSAYIS
jgi:hypothetical protein